MLDLAVAVLRRSLHDDGRAAGREGREHEVERGDALAVRATGEDLRLEGRADDLDDDRGALDRLTGPARRLHLQDDGLSGEEVGAAEQAQPELLLLHPALQVVRDDLVEVELAGERTGDALQDGA